MTTPLRSATATALAFAGLQRNVEQTMTELQRAAQSLRTLGDYLQRHPESIIRGKQADPPLGAKEPGR